MFPLTLDIFCFSKWTSSTGRQSESTSLLFLCTFPSHPALLFLCLLFPILLPYYLLNNFFSAILNPSQGPSRCSNNEITVTLDETPK